MTNQPPLDVMEPLANSVRDAIMAFRTVRGLHAYMDLDDCPANFRKYMWRCFDKETKYQGLPAIPMYFEDGPWLLVLQRTFRDARFKEWVPVRA